MSYSYSTFKIAIKHQEWLFPLNGHLFNDLLDNHPRFKEIYIEVYQMMEAHGVEFFSPGGSPKRRMTYWFNSQFWTDINFMYETFSVPDALYQELKELMQAVVYLPEMDDLPVEEEIIITDSHRLSEEGKMLLLNLAPLNQCKNIRFI